MATPASVTVEGLRKWLHFLDKQLAWSDRMTTTSAGYPVCQNTAELLKFGLHTELKCSQTQLTSLKSPSGVFDKLVESYNGDREKALRVYVFCLLTLGRKHRGLYAVQQLTSSRFGIPRPQQLTQALVTRKFFLFHCLLKIALSIKPATAEALMKHFGKEKYLGKNPRNIEHILDLFKQLWQKYVITETNTTKLTQYLEKCSELECAEYLEDYATGNFFEILQAVKYDDLETRDCIPTSAAETSDDGVAHQKGTRGNYLTREQIREESVSEYRRTASPDADANSVSTQTEQFEDDLSVTSSVDEGTTSRQTVHITDTLPDNALLQRGTVTASAESLSAGHLSYRRHQRGRKSLYVAAVVFLLMLILLGLGLSLAFLWSPLYNRSSTKVGRVNETIVLQEVNHYYFQSIQVKKDVQSGDSPQNLQAFLVDQTCNSLKTSEVIRLNVTNATSFDSKQNFTKEYLMPGSKISYKVNATLSDPEPEWMHITVTKGFVKAQGVKVARKAIQVGGHGKLKITSFEYEVPPGQWDYYSVDLIVPKENQYRYDATVKMVKIESESHVIANNVEENCTILESDKIQECSLPVSFRGIHAEGCLIGNVYEAVDTHHRHDSVHIVITQESFERGLASSAIPIGFTVVFIMLTLVAVFLIKCTSCCTLWSDNHDSYIPIDNMAAN